MLKKTIEQLQHSVPKTKLNQCGKTSTPHRQDAN